MLHDRYLDLAMNFLFKSSTTRCHKLLKIDILSRFSNFCQTFFDQCVSECDQFSVRILSVCYIEEKVI